MRANEEVDFDEVVSHLKADAGLTNAEVVATGGGIDCIRIPCGKYVLYFGTAAGTWGTDVYALVNGEEVCTDEGANFNVWTGVPSEEPDANAVALGIAQAVMEFDRKYCAAKREDSWNTR
ncbi:MAG: hypothetical protein ABR881_30855 [Candidatus Sulfotelmatobacter sp.]|jgi:hypothetical protein